MGMTPPTTPEDELERILSEFEDYCHGMYQGAVVYDKELAKFALLVRERRLCLEAQHSVLKPLDEITDNFGDDYGELSAQEDMEKYVTKTLAQINAELQKGKNT